MLELWPLYVFAGAHPVYLHTHCSQCCIRARDHTRWHRLWPWEKNLHHVLPRSSRLRSTVLLNSQTDPKSVCVYFPKTFFFEVHTARSEGATWMCLLNELCRGSWMECGLGCRAGLRFMCMCVTDAHLSVYTLGTPLPGPVTAPPSLPPSLPHPSSAAWPLTLGHSADPQWASVPLTAT